MRRVGLTTLFIEPGSPWENGCVESVDDKLQDDLSAREQFDALLEAKELIDRRRRHYDPVPNATRAVASAALSSAIRDDRACASPS